MLVSLNIYINISVEVYLHNLFISLYIATVIQGNIVSKYHYLMLFTSIIL